MDANCSQLTRIVINKLISKLTSLGYEVSAVSVDVLPNIIILGEVEQLPDL